MSDNCRCGHGPHEGLCLGITVGQYGSVPAIDCNCWHFIPADLDSVMVSKLPDGRRHAQSARRQAEA